MTRKPSTDKYTNDGYHGKYFTVMLNMADDDLDPFEYRLLAHYIRVAGASARGVCYQTVREVARITKMSVPKVISVRDTLEETGWITVEERPNKSHRIKIVDRMAENIARYAPAKDIEQSNDSICGDQNIEHGDQNIDHGVQYPAYEEQPVENNQNQKVDEPSGDGHPQTDSAFGFTIGQTVYYVHEPKPWLTEVLEGTVDRFSSKKIWVTFADKQRCLLPRNIKAERPALVRHTDEYEDLILEYSMHIPPTQTIGRSAAEYARDVKGQLLRMYPWLKPDQLRAAYQEKGDFVPSKPHLVIGMVSAYIKGHKLDSNGTRPVPIITHFPRGVPGCPHCGGTGMSLGPNNESVPCPLCLEAEARNDRQAAG